MTLRLPDELGAELRAAAEEDRRSVHQTIALAVEHYLAMRETAEVKADPDTLRALAEPRESIRKVSRLRRGRRPEAAPRAPTGATSGYELGTARPARQAIAEALPHQVAAAAVEFITDPLLTGPRRLGKPLEEELAGIYSARLGRDWRVFYEIDGARRTMIVLDIRPRKSAYRQR